MTTDLVTGTNGYSGAYVARRLLDAGHNVRTLTRDPAGVTGPVEAHTYTFDDPDALVSAFTGVDTFYNTYWVRFDRGSTTHDLAVANSQLLINAAAKAGVRRIVHVSIMHPSPDSPYPYQRGKALVETAVRNSGMSYAILRPSVLFGGPEILLSNIAWLLRRWHAFTVPGDGRYRLRPTHVEDLADLMVSLGARNDDIVRDAGGPETFEFGALVRMIRDAIGVRALVVTAPLGVVLPLTRVIGLVTNDVTIHRAELEALMDGLATCDGPPAGNRKYTDFLAENAAHYGRTYTNELRRNFLTAPDGTTRRRDLRELRVYNGNHG